MKNLTLSFSGGLLIAAGSLVLESFFSIFFFQEYLTPQSPLPFSFLLFSAIAEELLAIAVIYKLSRQWLSYPQSIFNGLLIAVGFSTLEIGLNISSHPSLLPVDGIIFISPFLIHLATAIFYAIISFWKKSPTAFYLGIALALGIALHLSYNLGFILN